MAQGTLILLQELQLQCHIYITSSYFHIQVLKVDKENPIKQVREKYCLCHLSIEKNYPVLHTFALQKYVNLCFQYLA